MVPQFSTSCQMTDKFHAITPQFFSESENFRCHNNYSMTQFEEKARDLIKKHEYLMLSESWCPGSHYAYKVWDLYGVRDKIHIIEFDKIPDQTEAKSLEDAFVALAGIKWVPTLFFHGSYFGTEKDLKRWEAEGKLQEIFKKEGLIE